MSLEEKSLTEKEEKTQKEMNQKTKIEIAKAAFKQIGDMTVEGCQSDNAELAKKFQELNKLAKMTYELLRE